MTRMLSRTGVVVLNSLAMVTSTCMTRYISGSMPERSRFHEVRSSYPAMGFPVTASSTETVIVVFIGMDPARSSMSHFCSYAEGSEMDSVVMVPR